MENQELQRVNGAAVDLTPAEKGDLLSEILSVARGATDLDKAERLFALAQQVRSADAESAFNRAMQAAQEEIKPVARDAFNPSNKSKYARLETVDNAIRPIYTKHGFALSFNSGPPKEPGNVRILCDVRHSAGHVKPYELEGGLDMTGAKGTANKTSIQGLGSSVSYLRRYLTLMIWNVPLVDEDNDGNRTVEFITEQEVLKIVDYLKELNIGETNEGFLAWCGVDKIDHIMPKGLPRVMNELQQRLIAKRKVDQA